MADQPHYRTPRWVKIAGIIALVVLLLGGILLLSGVGGDHGPGRHLPSGGVDVHVPLSSMTQDDARPATALTATRRA
jgi:hypothetical protein